MEIIIAFQLCSDSVIFQGGLRASQGLLVPPVITSWWFYPVAQQLNFGLVWFSLPDAFERQSRSQLCCFKVLLSRTALWRYPERSPITIEIACGYIPRSSPLPWVSTPIKCSSPFFKTVVLHHKLSGLLAYARHGSRLLLWIDVEWKFRNVECEVVNGNV
jgi:hypothetical protein